MIRCRISRDCPFRAAQDAQGHAEMRAHEVECRAFITGLDAGAIADALEVERYAPLVWRKRRRIVGRAA